MKELIEQGYATVSNKHKIVARIDRPDWKQFMADEGYFVSPRNSLRMANQYRRVYSKDKLRLSSVEGFPNSNQGPSEYVPKGRTMKKITPEMVEETDACMEGIKKFKDWLEERGWSGARPTARNLKAFHKEVYWETWAFAYGMGWVPWESVKDDPELRRAWLINTKASLQEEVWQTNREEVLEAVREEGANAAYDLASRVTGPVPELREIACSSPEAALSYARVVDKKYSKETFLATTKEDPDWERLFSPAWVRYIIWVREVHPSHLTRLLKWVQKERPQALEAVVNKTLAGEWRQL